jgi:hypothetical protein
VTLHNFDSALTVWGSVRLYRSPRASSSARPAEVCRLPPTNSHLILPQSVLSLPQANLIGAMQANHDSSSNLCAALNLLPPSSSLPLTTPAVTSFPPFLNPHLGHRFVCHMCQSSPPPSHTCTLTRYNHLLQHPIPSVPPFQLRLWRRFRPTGQLMR